MRIYNIYYGAVYIEYSNIPRYLYFDILILMMRIFLNIYIDIIYYAVLLSTVYILTRPSYIIHHISHSTLLYTNIYNIYKTSLYTSLIYHRVWGAGRAVWSYPRDLLLTRSVGTCTIRVYILIIIIIISMYRYVCMSIVLVMLAQQLPYRIIINTYIRVDSMRTNIIRGI